MDTEPAADTVPTKTLGIVPWTDFQADLPEGLVEWRKELYARAEGSPEQAGRRHPANHRPTSRGRRT